MKKIMSTAALALLIAVPAMAQTTAPGTTPPAAPAPAAKPEAQKAPAAAPGTQATTPAASTGTQATKPGDGKVDPKAAQRQGTPANTTAPAGMPNADAGKADAKNKTAATPGKPADVKKQ